MNAFWALVKNDTGYIRKPYVKKFNWFWIYLIGGVLIGLIQYTIFLLHAENVDFDVRYIAPVFILVFIVASGKIISREWRRDTVGWWLTLPYPRTLLLRAKIVASFIRLIKTAVLIGVTISILFLEALIVRPDLFTAAVVLELLSRALQLFGLLLVFSPFAVTAGVALRLVSLSKWRPSAPLFWVCIPTLFLSAVSFFTDGWEGLSLAGAVMVQRFSILLLLEIVIVVLLRFLSIYILENKIEA